MPDYGVGWRSIDHLTAGLCTLGLLSKPWILQSHKTCWLRPGWQDRPMLKSNKSTCTMRRHRKSATSLFTRWLPKICLSYVHLSSIPRSCGEMLLHGIDIACDQVISVCIKSAVAAISAIGGVIAIIPLSIPQKLKSIWLHLDPRNLAITPSSFIQFKSSNNHWIPRVFACLWCASRSLKSYRWKVSCMSHKYAISKVCDRWIKSLHKHFRGPSERE